MLCFWPSLDRSKLGIKQWDSNALFRRSMLVVTPSSAFFCREHNQQEKEFNFPRKRRTMFSEFVSLLRWARRHVYQFFDCSNLRLLPYCESRLTHHFRTWSDLVSMNNSQYECKAPNPFLSICEWISSGKTQRTMIQMETIYQVLLEGTGGKVMLPRTQTTRVGISPNYFKLLLVTSLSSSFIPAGSLYY